MNFSFFHTVVLQPLFHKNSLNLTYSKLIWRKKFARASDISFFRSTVVHSGVSSTMWKNVKFSLTKNISSLLYSPFILATRFFTPTLLLFYFCSKHDDDFFRFVEASGATRLWTRLFDRCKTRCIGYRVVYLYQMFCNDNQVYYFTLHRNPILSKAKSKGT